MVLLLPQADALVAVHADASAAPADVAATTAPAPTAFVSTLAVAAAAASVATRASAGAALAAANAALAGAAAAPPVLLLHPQLLLPLLPPLPLFPQSLFVCFLLHDASGHSLCNCSFLPLKARTAPAGITLMACFALDASSLQNPTMHPIWERRSST